MTKAIYKESFHVLLLQRVRVHGDRVKEQLRAHILIDIHERKRAHLESHLSSKTSKPNISDGVFSNKALLPNPSLKVLPVELLSVLSGFEMYEPVEAIHIQITSV